MHTTTKNLLNVALTDIKASHALYDLKHYSQSFFLFQQATEKTYKAFGLIGNIITDKDFKKINHLPLKIYKNILDKDFENAAKTIQLLELIPELKKHEVFADGGFENYYEQLKKEQQLIDRLWKTDLKKLTTDDHNTILDQLAEIDQTKFELPDNHNEIFQRGIESTIGLFQTLSPASAEEMRNELKKGNTQAEFIEISKWFMKISFDMIYISKVLFWCSVVTMSGHAETSRYPHDGIDPLTFYRKSYPGTKFQLEYLRFLKKCISKIKGIQVGPTINAAAMG